INERNGKCRCPRRACGVYHPRVRIADLVDVAKELINEIAGLLKIVELYLLARSALLGYVHLRKDSASNNSKNRHHQQHLKQGKTVLSISNSAVPAHVSSLRPTSESSQGGRNTSSQLPSHLASLKR